VTGFLTTIAVGRIWVMSFWRGGPVGTPDGESIAVEDMPLADPADRRDMLLPVIGLTALVIALGFLPRPYSNVAVGGAGGLLYSGSYVDAVLGADTSSEAVGQEVDPDSATADDEPAPEGQSGDGS
jgi:multicomponent Na+:H+ antiporter subunit D